jgi:hypothetical protein
MKILWVMFQWGWRSAKLDIEDLHGSNWEQGWSDLETCITNGDSWMQGKPDFKVCGKGSSMQVL